MKTFVLKFLEPLTFPFVLVYVAFITNKVTISQKTSELLNNGGTVKNQWKNKGRLFALRFFSFACYDERKATEKS